MKKRSIAVCAATILLMAIRSMAGDFWTVTKTSGTAAVPFTFTKPVSLLGSLSVGGSSGSAGYCLTSNGISTPTWRREAEIDVRTYGAVANGVTDDLTPLTNAINAVALTSGTVLIGDPIYISDPSSIPNKSNVTLKFVGQGRLVLNFNSVQDVQVYNSGAYSAIPTISFSTGGATASALMGARRPEVIVSSGTGYGLRDELTLVGGTSSTAAKLEVTGISAGGVIQSARVVAVGSYTALPSNPVSVTGGTGSSATFNIVWQIASVSVASGGSSSNTPTVSPSSSGTLAPHFRARGKCFTWGGGIIADKKQIFAGNGRVLLTGSSIKEIYPQWFGAIGDGTTDCAESIQRALDTSSGKTFFIPAGTYAVSVEVVPPATCRIAGEGQYLSILKPTADVNVIRLTTGFEMYLNDFGIVDSDQNQTYGSGIFFDNSRNGMIRVYAKDLIIDRGSVGIQNWNYEAFGVLACSFENIFISNRAESVAFYYTTANRFINVVADHVNIAHSTTRDFWFYGNDADIGGGLTLEKVISQFPSNYGIVIEAPATHAWPRFMQVWIRDSSVDMPGDVGMYIKGEQVRVESGYYASVDAANDITVTDSIDVSFMGSEVYGANSSGNGIGVYSSTNVSVSGGQISTFSNSSGVLISASSQCVVSGVEISSNKYGVTATGSDFLQVVGNTFESNTSGSLNIAALPSKAILFDNSNAIVSGNVGIGTISPATPLHVEGTAATLATIKNTSDYARLRLNGATSTGADIVYEVNGSAKWGLVSYLDHFMINEGDSVAAPGLDIAPTTRYVDMPGVYAETTASAANVFVTSNGSLQRSTSSKKYKTGIKDYTRGLDFVNKLRPVTYMGKNDKTKTKHAGLIAEEVDAAGLKEFVVYGPDGKPDALEYQNMIALLINTIKEMDARIKKLEGK